MKSLRYHSDPTRAVSLGTNGYVLFSNLNSPGVVISIEQFTLLRQCQLPRTLQEHTKIIGDMMMKNPSGIPLGLGGHWQIKSLRGWTKHRSSEQVYAYIESQLLALVSLCLLTPVLNADTDHSDATQQGISKLGFVTLNRPAALARSLRSHLGAMLEFGRHPNGYIVDGSVDPTMRDTTIRSILKSTERLGSTLTYIGLREKEQLRDKLINAAPVDVLTFALLGSSEMQPQTGANRNCLMLATLDELIFCVDDDTANCSLTLSSDPSQKVRFTSSNDMEIYEFGFRCAPVGSLVSDSGSDTVTEHENLTGRTLSQVLQRYDSCCEFADIISPQLGCAIRRPSRFHIGITVSGIVGSSGTYSPAGLLNLSGRSKSNLFRSEECYENAILSDRLIRRALVPTLTDNPWCMMTAYSIDHGLVCLPFMPAFRNQDGLFARMVRCCFPEILFAHATTVVKHDNSTEKKFMRPFEGVCRIRMADLMDAFVPPTSNPEFGPLRPISLATIGGNLVSASQMRDEDLQDYLAHRIRFKLSSTYHLWQEALVQSNEFPAVRRDLESGLRALQAVMTSPNCWMPIDRPTWVTEAECIKFVKTFLENFGLLIQFWPSIINAMRELREAGYQIGTEVSAGKV